MEGKACLNMLEGYAEPAVPLTGSDQFGSAHGFKSTPLPPGAHTARVQWRTDLGSEMCVDARSLIVLHR